MRRLGICQAAPSNVREWNRDGNRPAQLEMLKAKNSSGKGSIHPLNRKIEEYDDWENTGYGLYLTKGFALRGAAFSYATGTKDNTQKPMKTKSI